MKQCGAKCFSKKDLTFDFKCIKLNLNLKGEVVMMGHREKMKTGDERDALTDWHHWEIFKAGQRKQYKRKFHRRTRRSTKQDLRKKTN